MGQLLLFIVVAVVVAAIVFGVTVMLGGGDSGLTPVEADGRAVPLPTDRPLGEDDMGQTKFDVVWRGYRMAQVDQALQRAAYDIGYKGELIGVLEAEVIALRDGRLADADVLRKAREAAVAPIVPAPASPDGEGPVIELSVVPPDEIATESAAARDTEPAATRGTEPAATRDREPAAAREDAEPSTASDGEPATGNDKSDDEKVEESEAAERR
jgi:DivIVA domain-containing protein